MWKNERHKGTTNPDRKENFSNGIVIDKAIEKAIERDGKDIGKM